MLCRCAFAVAAAAAVGSCSGRSGLRRVEHLEASANIRLDVDAQRFEEPAPGTDLRDTAGAGVAVRGVAGGRVGAAIGVDLGGGAGLQGGFAYHAALRPLGVGLHIGRLASFAVTGGAAIDGVTEHVDFAVRWPLEATLTIEIGDHLHLDGWAELAWISAAGERQSGSESAPFGDELTCGVAVRVGRGETWRLVRWGNGYFIGGTYAELLGVRRVGLMFGYGLNAHYRKDR